MAATGTSGSQNLTSLHALIFPGTAESVNTLQSLAEVLKSTALEALVSTFR